MHLVPPPSEATPSLSCRFCLKSQAEVVFLVAGPDEVAICDVCVGLSRDIVEDKVPAPPVVPDLEDTLTTELLGQAEAKAVLPVILRRAQSLPPGARAPVVLMVGPPGTGKTHAAELLARCAGMPGHHAHASRLSAVGYVGEQLGNLLADVQNEGLAPEGPGLLIIDGVEGLGRPGSPATPRQIDGEDVQTELRIMLDDAAISLPLHGQARVQTGRLLRVLVATLDPLPPTEELVRAALVEAGLLAPVVARIDEVVRFERRSADELAPLAEGLELTAEAAGAVLEAAAEGDGAWVLHALGGERLARAWTGAIDLDTLQAWGLP